MNCLFCHTDTVRCLGSKKDHAIDRSCNFFQCTMCGFAFTDYTINWFPNNYLYTTDDYYAVTGDESSADKTKAEKWEHDCSISRERVDRYMEAVRSEWRSLLTLDVGCSNGAMPYISRKDYGLHSIGFEINDAYPNWDKLEEEGVSILGLEKDSRWFDIELCNFDVITFYDVFEHMSDPFMHMEMVAEMLKFGGIVVFEQPNPASETCYEQGLAWKHFRPFQHFYLFSKENFEEMFEMFGLKMVLYIEHLPGRFCIIGKKI